MTKPYYAQTAEELAESLKTSIDKGLSPKEVQRRHNEYGYNELEKKKKKGLFIKFLAQFKSFMIIVLLVAAVISGIIGFLHGEGFTDAIIILAIVILNAIIGVAQESKAERSLEALEKMSSPHCKVIRDGQMSVITSRELVPGDLVVLETGDSVPADIRLTGAINLKIQEAALTGESVPEEKFTHPIDDLNSPLGDRDNMVYASGSVSYGRGSGIVTETGMKTEVGKIAFMIQSVPDTQTPLQQRLDKLGKMLGITALAICALLFVIGLLYGKPVVDMFMTAVSLAAAAIPEGLPAVSTIVLAVGVQRLVKKNAIVRTLPSVEALGSTTVICSDKTGTLTQNKMTVVRLYTNGATITTEDALKKESTDREKLIEIAILANDTNLTNDGKTTGDPTETSLVDLGLKFSIDKNKLDNEYPRVKEIPFDSERKLMTTVHRINNDSYIVCTKGGLDELLTCCSTILDNGQVSSLDGKSKESIANENIAMAKSALRVLAMAYKELDHEPNEMAGLEKDLTFIGMVGMIDPPRLEVKDAVDKCRTAGIKPVMITGDHKITAMAIATDSGIMNEGDRAITGSDLMQMSDDELFNQSHDISVYARVAPEDKVRIVKAFQKSGDVVAMTGDGVNDAPALKLANIGCAMGITGTDVAKEASDIVLTDDNFSTIVTAVEEGRRIYDNILKAIQFMLSTNIGEILVLFVAVLANWISPLLPIHILWINLVTDSLPALALSVDPSDPDSMKRKPIDARKGIMTRDFTLRILLQGTMIGLLSLVAYRIGLQSSIEAAQTMTFEVLAISQIMHVFNVRSASHSAFRNMFSNKYLLGAIALVLSIMIALLEVPLFHDLFHLTTLTSTQWIWVVVLSIAPLPIVELVKGIIRLRFKITLAELF
ncbi:MAG: calcium-translocating P-type ATPase, PMCA-type [Prevotellaceae bacterium]|jgi:Ca2+-transporting ATPase|nr:calcium-translocating P-type ATPase, PMCA-type [Prevotellaceae bacterium]